MMLIGELAQRTGLSRDTIRFYEKLGLISPAQRNARNGYREYDGAMVDRLFLITQAKALGFTLSEIQQEVEAWQTGQLSQEEKIRIFQEKIEQVNSRIQQLYDLKTYLVSKLEKLQQGAL